MSKFENVYELKEDISANGLTFFFVSKGNQDNFVEWPKTDNQYYHAIWYVLIFLKTLVRHAMG